MKLANVAGRAAIVVDGGVIDVATASDGRFGPEPAGVFDQWVEFRSWAESAGGDILTLDRTALGAPSPSPRQVFGVGLNYRGHAAESGMDVPSIPAVFTKFPASLGGPDEPVVLRGQMVDWEVELVAIIGIRSEHVAVADGWDHVAGLCVGQDISDRLVQFQAGSQFSLGKSFPTYGPTGPWLVTPDELDDPDDLALGCSIDGETVQDDRTSDLIFGVPRLVAELSAIVPLLPGDLVFTGTPAGVGATRTPPRFLQPGEVLESWIEGIGTITNPVVAQEA
jgi:2-keto-4-pentenoate hydratase/2-oxohepta-3-ene-1,7-dioic acid hydratase in catechol pathway